MPQISAALDEPLLLDSPTASLVLESQPSAGWQQDGASDGVAAKRASAAGAPAPRDTPGGTLKASTYCQFGASLALRLGGPSMFAALELEDREHDDDNDDEAGQACDLAASEPATAAPEPATPVAAKNGLSPDSPTTPSCGPSEIGSHPRAASEDGGWQKAARKTRTSAARAAQRSARSASMWCLPARARPSTCVTLQSRPASRAPSSKTWWQQAKLEREAAKAADEADVRKTNQPLMETQQTACKRAAQARVSVLGAGGRGQRGAPSPACRERSGPLALPALRCTPLLQSCSV